MDDLVRMPEVPFKTFTSMGKLINREIKQCRYIEMLVAYKFKVLYDRVENPAIATLVKRVGHEGLRQDLAKVFLELFRLLRYLEFIERDLTHDRPLKHSLLVFSLVNSELRQLFDFIETRICRHPEVSAAVRRYSRRYNFCDEPGDQESFQLRACWLGLSAARPTHLCQSGE